MQQTNGWSREKLTYCSNVHPGASLADIHTVIKDRIAEVRRLRCLERMGSGLWISAQAAEILSEDSRAMATFSQQLRESGIDLFTLNGFPYDDFHTARVKEGVYRPSWATAERLSYTLNLARILATCLPADESFGTISTLPLGYAPEWCMEKHKQALSHLCHLVKSLIELKRESGRHIRVCLEMEPGCLLEHTEQAIALFNDDLTPTAVKLGLTKAQLLDHIGICFDICHQAVMFESPAQSLSAFEEAGITIGKIQISSALELQEPANCDPEKVLQEFMEPRYFHQVRCKDEDGRLAARMDLPDIVSEAGLPKNRPWRIHFHTPIQAATTHENAVGTTQDAIVEVLEYLKKHPEVHPHLEVETYTWQILPRALRPITEADLHKGLCTELEWLEQQMQYLGLLQEPSA